MTPHPRIRTAIKWGGAAVTVLLVVVWFASGWWYIAVGHRHWFSSVEVGLLHFTMHSGHQLLPIRAVSFGSTVSSGAPARWYWWFKAERFHGGPWTGFTLQVPLWAPTSALVACSAAAWAMEALRRRRVRAGLCPDCHYDRTGLAASAKCPECGAAPAAR